MYNGKPIKEKRKELGLSAKELAELIGVKEGNIYKWEKGTKPHDPEDFLKIQNWLSGKSETVTQSKNGSVVSNKPQGSHETQKQGLDLIKEVNRLREREITVEATLSVILSELVHLIAKDSGRSHASVSSQLKKDVLTEIENLRSLDKK